MKQQSPAKNFILNNIIYIAFVVMLIGLSFVAPSF